MAKKVLTPEIKEIKVLKPRIKEIKKEESELEEDIEEAEQEERGAMQSGNFQAPSIILESDRQEAPRRTQIQQETQERRQIETTNASYTNTPQRRDTYREYTPNALRSSEVVADRSIATVSNQQTLGRREVIQDSAIQRTQEINPTVYFVKTRFFPTSILMCCSYSN